jgi:hypothetical protein
VTAARHELISLTEPERWAQALREVPHGHAHTWGFCNAVQKTSTLPTYLYRYVCGQTRVVCPISERGQSGRCDVVSPYGIAGFAKRGTAAGFAVDWTDFARTRDWVCGYIALHPLLDVPAGFQAEELHAHNRLYVMQLQRTDDELLKAMSKKRRKQLRDWPVIEAGIVHNRDDLITFLLANYADFFALRGAGAATRFTPVTIGEIADLGDVLIMGRGNGDRLESVAVWGYTNHIAESLLSVSVPGGEVHGIPLMWAGIRALRNLGVTWLNLGGGVRPGDSIAESKRRFGACERDFLSVRQVFQPELYAELCREVGRDHHDRSGYFPAYRR